MNIAEQIQNLIGSAPDDLVNLYKHKLIYDESCRVNFLDFEKAYEYSEMIQGGPLGVWVLDDANDSNPYCYLTKGPCEGAILYLSHDPEPEIRFSSLENFIDAINKLIKAGNDIDEIKSENNLKFPLNNSISTLCDDESDDATFLICTYLPVCLNLKQETKIKLTLHEDFYVREAFALWLQKNGTNFDLEFAEKLSKDKIGQVSNPANVAKEKIKIKNRLDL